MVAACAPGFADCNGSIADGCEADLRVPANCGSCGHACSAGQVCNGGTCASSCSAGRVLCNGACLDTQNDPSSCGGCTKACALPSHGQPTCSAGQCGAPVCDAGYTPCNGACLDATAILSDPFTCGASCATITACVAPGQARTTCTAGVCGGCSPGFSVCGGACTDISYDVYNCGGCGKSCLGACRNGVCTAGTPVWQTGTKPTYITNDALYVYWIDAGTNSILRAAKAGGAPQVLAAGQAGPSQLAVDATSVYFTAPQAPAVMVMPKTGGTPQILALSQSNGVPDTLAIDATDVYFSDGAINRVSKAGGAVTTLVPPSLYMDGRIALDATSVYYTEVNPNATQSLYRVSKAGGASVYIGGGLIGTVGPGLLWNYSVAPAVIFAFPIDGAMPAALPLVVSPAEAIVSMAADAAYAWAALSTADPMKSSGIRRIPADPTCGEAPVFVYQSPAFPGAPAGITVDSTYVYWTEGTTIARMLK